MSVKQMIETLSPVTENNPQGMLEQLQNGTVYAELGVDENAVVNVTYLFAVKDGILCAYNLVGTTEAKLRLNLACAAIANSETVYILVYANAAKHQRALFSCKKDTISDAEYFACCPDGDYSLLNSNAWELIKRQLKREPKLVLALEPNQNLG